MTTEEMMNTIRTTVAEVLEVDLDQISQTSRFKEELGADSLQAIEILARMEKLFKVQIDQAELSKMTSLEAVHEVVMRSAGDKVLENSGR